MKPSEWRQNKFISFCVDIDISERVAKMKWHMQLHRWQLRQEKDGDNKMQQYLNKTDS